MSLLCLITSMMFGSIGHADDDPRLISHCAALMMSPRRTAVSTADEARFLISRLLRKAREQIGSQDASAPRYAEYRPVQMMDVDFMGVRTKRDDLNTLVRSAARLNRLDFDIGRENGPLTMVRVSRGSDAIHSDLQAAAKVARLVDERVPRVETPKRPNFLLEAIALGAGGAAVGATLPKWASGLVWDKVSAMAAVTWLTVVWGRMLIREVGYLWRFKRERRDSAADVNLALAGFNMGGALAPDAYHAAHLGFHRRVPHRLIEAIVNGRSTEDFAPEDLDARRALAKDDSVLLVDHVMLKDEADLILVSVVRVYGIEQRGGRRKEAWPQESNQLSNYVPAF